MNEITTVGVDLAKEVIVVCAGDAEGRTVFFRQFSFAGFAEWAANLPACLIGLEACSSAHHWARFLTQHGHTAKLMAAELVEPYRLSRGAKNDRNDAQAILSAVRQPNMRFVTVKSIDQQAMLAWHRSRAGYLEERKALLNRTRGLLAEFGLWLGRSSAVLRRQLPRLAEDERLPARFRPILTHVIEHLRQIDARIDECDVQIREHARHSEHARRLQTVLGIGNITASALIATIANPRDFRNGRQLSAWCGLVPRQRSSGGKARLGVITKRGDAYLRGLLTQGARSTMQAALKREPLRRSRLEHWIVALHDRAGYHKTLVAIANKHLRTVWAILAHNENYDPNAWRRHPRAAAMRLS
ncbi:MAG: IS110 family transposase [Hyphomicrobiaceae bacterium]|nr:MAG: IS110 family transposase [Hyphomicrobiaceae bacterium]